MPDTSKAQRQTKRVVIKNMADVFTVGKTKIRITTDGCVYCGTEYSSGWQLDRLIRLQVGKRVDEVAISCCADCQNKKDPSLFDLPSTREAIVEVT